MSSQPPLGSTPLEGGSLPTGQGVADRLPAPTTARSVGGGILTVLACGLVTAALVAPNTSRLLTPAAFVRVPLEGLLAVGFLLLLPERVRSVASALIGTLLGSLLVVKLFDIGFFTVLARPFDPLNDWELLDDATGFLRESMGPMESVMIVTGVAVLLAGIPVLTVAAVRRIAGAAVRHRGEATSGVAVLGLVWTTCSLAGTHVVPGVPVASRSASILASAKVLAVKAGLDDRRTFSTEIASDPFRHLPADRLLAGLRGKDVLVAFVESYGRDAVENPRIAPGVNAVLDDGTRRLAARGFSARSGFLTSPTAGGGSWLAHTTFLSGLWVDDQQRYRTAVSSDRLTLGGAFRRAGWRTVGVVPGVTRAWPEGRFFGLGTVYDSRNLGYRGPHFGWAPVPDQYTLLAYERLERGRPGPGKPGRGPIMAEIPLVSSHGPWAPLPKMIGWNAVGDGSVYTAMAASGGTADDVLKDTERARPAYQASIEYSLSSLISYVETYGDDDTVVVFAGDHQPAPLITGEDAGRDVPITVVARDRAVLDRTSGWGWDDGLRPGPSAARWPMSAFRDRFLTAFSSSSRSDRPFAGPSLR